MKPGAKLVLIFVAILAILPVLAWVGALVYWHVTITMEIRDLEHQPPLSRATFVVVSGGCRALPYLMDALESTRSLAVLDSAVLGMPIEVDDTGRPTAGEEAEALRELFKKYPFDADDPPDVRRKSYQQIRAWWDANRTKYHQWWRVWSSSCSRSRGEGTP